MAQNAYPKLHNAMWPGLVGKGEDEPPISLDAMLDMTQAAEVNGVKFDGVDLFLADPHTSIDVDDGAFTSYRRATTDMLRPTIATRVFSASAKATSSSSTSTTKKAAAMSQ